MSKIYAVLFISVLIIVCLLVSIAYATVPIRQCFNPEPAPPESYSCVGDQSNPKFYTSDNLKCNTCKHWSTICNNLENGINLFDGKDAVQEGLIKQGDANRIPGKPRAACLVRIDNLVKACQKSDHAVITNLHSLLSEIKANEGLTKNYMARNTSPLDQTFGSKWLEFDKNSEAILNAWLSSPQHRCQ